MSEGMSYREEIEESVHAVVTELPEWDADAGDSIHQTAENWTIYTGKCHYVMRESRNEDAGFEHMGPDVLDGCQSFSDVVTKLAFWAVYQDLWDEMGTLSDADKLEARDEALCDECGEVFPASDLDALREGREGDNICEGCHDDWLEDQEDEDDNTDEGEE